MIFCYKWSYTFLYRMPGHIDWCIKKCMVPFKKIRLRLISFLWDHLWKKWGHQNIALSKLFNFYSKHFLIFWRISEIFIKKDWNRNSGNDRKIFVQKFDFVSGEYDTIGGRSKNFSEKWRQILGIPEILRNDVKFLEF